MTAATRAPDPPVRWSWKRFDALTGDDVYDLLTLRSDVFVVEQQCVFLDADGCDRDAWHLLGRVDAASGTTTSRFAPLAAYLRCLDPGIKYVEPSIGRVTVAARHRRGGLGRALMCEGIARARAQWPGKDLVIGAQSRLEAFYASLGFCSEGPPYIEDGIAHVEMRLVSNPASSLQRAPVMTTSQEKQR